MSFRDFRMIEEYDTPVARLHVRLVRLTALAQHLHGLGDGATALAAVAGVPALSAGLLDFCVDSVVMGAAGDWSLVRLHFAEVCEATRRRSNR